MTLGAAPIAVVRTLVREHLLASTIGLIAGGIASAWWIGVLQSYTYQTPVYDVRAWAAAIGAISLVVLLGTLVPSIRASHIDPVRALRVD
jgi:ABC-type lipoprotein release transport system permease subunit